MRIDYDPQADAIYLRLRAGEVADTLATGKHIYVDVDAEGLPLGIEILFVSRLLTQDETTSFTVNVSQLAHLLSAPLPV